MPAAMCQFPSSLLSKCTPTKRALGELPVSEDLGHLREQAKQSWDDSRVAAGMSILEKSASPRAAAIEAIVFHIFQFPAGENRSQLLEWNFSGVSRRHH